jgi:hypothetical protein
MTEGGARLYFGGGLPTGAFVVLSDGAGVSVGGGRAEPVVLGAAGAAVVEPVDPVELDVLVLVSAPAVETAAALDVDPVAALFEAMALPDHQSFFARCAGEAFR